MTAAEIRQRLRGVTRDGRSAYCPVHEGDGKAHRPSLTINEGAEGKLLLKCQAGCSIEDVVGALGLTMADLFAPSLNGNDHSLGHRIVCTYDYHDAAGHLLYQAVRLAAPKDFRLRRPDPAHPGQWIWKVVGVVPLVPYRLHELRQAMALRGKIFVVEGEKDADRLADLGLYATTNPIGACKWHSEYNPHFAGADITIVPDNDEPGRKHAGQVARELSEVAASVRVLELPGLPDKGDVSDWLDAGHTVGELATLAGQCRPWSVSTSEDPSESTSPKVGLVVRCAKDIVPRPISWLWRRRLPLGRYIELVGYPGIGKTALVMDVIAWTTTDGLYPDGDRGDPRDAIIAAAEDDAEDVLVPRLIAAGADLSRVHFVEGIRRAGADEMADIDLSKAIDFSALLKLFETTKAGLGFIDALDDVLGAKFDGKGQTETRRALAPIRRLAKQTGAAILGLRHPTKRIALGPALNAGNGSIAYGGVARGSMLVTIDPEDPNRRLLLATKSNVSRLADTLAFRLECQANEDDPPKVIWDLRPDPRTADDVLADLRSQEQANPNDAEAEQSKVARAEELVRTLLTGQDGRPTWVAVTDLERLARQRDVTPKTLRAAKENLKLQYHRDGFGRGSRMLGALPGIAPYSPPPANKGEYSDQQTATGLEHAVSSGAAEPYHTSPSHTRPQGNTGLRTSMTDGSDELELADREPPPWLADELDSLEAAS